MNIELILSVALTLLSTQAEKCLQDQQCSNCTSATQFCNTECSSRYYGSKCKLRCSQQCINSTCSLTLSGIGKCSDGCVPGFYGPQCNIPCTPQEGNCTKCPQGCDGTFCHLTSSCVAGCHDHYYGFNCKSCSPRCRQCNRITGRCDVCHDPYHGLDCEYSCEQCSTTGCVQTCAPGFYGRTCSLRCKTDCLSYPTAITNDNLTNNSSHSCTSDCQRYTGKCVNDQSAMNETTIGITVTLVVLVFGIVVAVCIYYSKRVSINREESHQMEDICPQSDLKRQSTCNSSRKFRNSEHVYSDVKEDGGGPVIVFL